MDVFRKKRIQSAPAPAMQASENQNVGKPLAIPHD
jgi:hypothetical protein